MMRVASTSGRGIGAILSGFKKVMKKLHPRINPDEHLDVLKTIGDLTAGGGDTTVSQVIEEMRIRGVRPELSDGQIRSRIKDLEKESYITMKYKGPKVIFVHERKGVVMSWKNLDELLKELERCLRRNRNASALVRVEMRKLRSTVRTDFIGFIKGYNVIVKKIAFIVNCDLHFIEIRGMPKRINLTIMGWCGCCAHPYSSPLSVGPFPMPGTIDKT